MFHFLLYMYVCWKLGMKEKKHNQCLRIERFVDQEKSQQSGRNDILWGSIICTLDLNC
jgi:hypothetical protein